MECKVWHDCLVGVSARKQQDAELWQRVRDENSTNLIDPEDLIVGSTIYPCVLRVFLIVKHRVALMACGLVSDVCCCSGSIGKSGELSQVKLGTYLDRMPVHELMEGYGTIGGSSNSAPSGLRRRCVTCGQISDG